MKTDVQLAQDVQDELRFDPEAQIADLQVFANGDTVDLHGTAPNIRAKWAADNAAHRVKGVVFVNDNISINPTMRSDDEVEGDVRAALLHDVSVPADTVQVEVSNGVVQLSGSVQWFYQRQSAEDDARKVYGVQSVENDIRIDQAAASGPEVHDAIQQALVRNARIDADTVQVSVDGSHVTLSGQVRSWAERQEAESAAWRAQGVNQVTDNLQVA